MNRNIPKRRFKGYLEHWEEVLLGEVSEILAGGDVNKKKLKKTGEFPVIGNGLVNEGILGYYDFEYRISAPAVTVTGRGDVGLAKARFKNFTPVVRLLVVKYEGDNVFLENSLNLKNFYVESTGVPQLTVPQLGKYIIKIPNFDEQKLIGSFFKNLDEQIDKQGKKVEKLKNLKKAYLSEIFPAEGELSPKRRFKGFTEPWEEKKLGEVTYKIDYGLNAPAGRYDGENKYIRITDIDETTRIFLNTDLTSPECNLETADNYLLKNKDILFARTGASVGKSYIYRKSDGKVYFAGFLIRFRIDNNHSDEFIYQYTFTKHYKKFVLITSQRSGQPGINSQEYAEMKMLFPSLPEQKLIGSFFKNLDDEINLEQKKLEKLKQLKQAYLEEMFV